MANEVPPETFRWAMLAMSYAISFLYLLSMQSCPPVMPLIMKEFGVTHAEAGLLMIMYSLPVAFLAIPSGLIVDRYGVKRLGISAAFCIIAGSSIIANSQSFLMVIAGQVISGFGGMLIGIIAPVIISQWFPPHELGKSMGTYATTKPLATVVAFTTFSFLGITYGWRIPFYIIIMFGIIILPTFWWLVREGPFLKKFQGKKTREKAGTALSHFEVWKVSIVYLLFSMAASAFNTWAPTFFLEFKGIGLVYGTFLVSMRSLVNLPFIPFFGWLSDRLGKRKIFILIGCALMSLLYLLTPLAVDSSLLVLIVALGIVVSMIPSIGFSLISEIVGSSRSGGGYGIFRTCLAAEGAAPVLVGYVRDVTGSEFYSFAAIATFSGGATFLSIFFKTR